MQADCLVDRQTVSLALRCPQTVEGQQPNYDRAPAVHSNTPDVDVRRSTSELQFNCVCKLMRRALEVAAELPATVSRERHRAVLAKAGSERVEDAAPGKGFLQIPVASDCLTECYNVLNTLTIYWGMV
jgi:hypothetical protein